MDRAGVHSAPFGEFRGLIRWVSVRERWQAFHGWSLSRGIRPLELNGPQFLDLVHYFTQHGKYPEVQVAEELDPAPEIVVNESKIPPPKWWKNTSTTQGDMLAAWEARNT